MSEKHRIRTKKFSLYLLEEEYEYLRKGAFEYDLSLSVYLRQLIVAGEIRGRHWTMDKEQGKQILQELNHIGNNINLIAYQSYGASSVLPDDWKQLKKSYFELLTLLGKLPFLTTSTQEQWAILATELLLSHTMEL